MKETSVRLSLAVLLGGLLVACGGGSEDAADPGLFSSEDRWKEEVQLRPPGETAIKPRELADTPAPSAIDVAPPEGLDDLVKRAEALAPAAERLRSAIDRTQFDITELAVALDLEPDRLAQFVADSIFFEQYPGVLRGPEGTLLSRSGNALDQALLLGALLDEAALDWRIARGALTAEDAAALVNRMAQARPAELPPGDEREIRAAMEDIYRVMGVAESDQARLFETDEAENRAFFDAVTVSDTRFILNALAQAGQELGDPGAMAELIEEARDYFWVEYRTDAYQEWVTAHPAFGDREAPTVSRQETFTTPADDLYHRVRFEVFIEQKINDQLHARPVVSREAPAPDWVGKPLTYSNYPDNLRPETASDLVEMIKGISVFLPVLDGALQGNAFDLDGRTFSVGLIGLDEYGLTEVFQRQAQQLEQGIGGLSTLGVDEAERENADDIFTLTAQWMQYTLIAPGGKEETHRRYLMDRVGVVNREAGIAEITDPAEVAVVARELLTATTVSVLPGSYVDAYALERVASRLKGEIELLQRAGESFDSTGLDLLPPEDLLLAAALDAGSIVDRRRRSYRSEPTLVVYQQGEFERVDIVNHSRRHFYADGELRADPVGAVQAGVWESFAERAPLRSQAAVEDTGIAFRQAQQNDLAMHVLLPSDIERVDELTHTEATKLDLAKILARGDIVVVPESPLPGETEGNWWRVNAATGETLGMATGGFGVANTERITLSQTLVQKYYATRVLSVASFAGCLAAGGSAACCGLVGGVFFVHGGALVWAKAYKAALALSALSSPLVVGASGRTCG